MGLANMTAPLSANHLTGEPLRATGKHIGIAGAGLMGRLLAWQLLRCGHRVGLFDRDKKNGEASAGRVAAAMLAPYSEALGRERAIFDWGLESITLWPRLLAQLEHDSGVQVSFQHRGSVVVAHQQDRSSLRHFNQRLTTQLPDRLDAVEYCDQQRLCQLEPELADTFTDAIFLKDEGCLDNWALLDALAIAIEKLGGQWHEDAEVTQVNSAVIVNIDETHTFDTVIDARGFGAKAQTPGLRGVRGEVLWVRAPDVRLSRPVRLMHPRYQLYIAPKPDSIYVIGATEIESESVAPITVRSSLELLSALYSVHTSFAEAHIIRAFAQCRPAFMDNLPRIECVDDCIKVNGLYRHGYLLAPVVLQATLSALQGNFHHPLVNTSCQAARVAEK